MRLKRTLIFILVFCLIGTVTVFAADAYERLGIPVKVVVNGETLKESGVLVDNTTLLPLRAVANQLRAVVDWDQASKTVNIYKPNVHITLVQNLKGGVLGTFGNVPKGKINFKIFTQIEGLMVPVDKIKFTIEDPYGKTVYTYEYTLQQKSEKDFWVFTPGISLNFEHLGTYKVNVFMKLKDANNGEYFLVAEKQIRSIK